MPRINRHAVIDSPASHIVLMETLIQENPDLNKGEIGTILANLPTNTGEVLLDFRPTVISEKAPPQVTLPLEFIRKLADFSKTNKVKSGLILAGSTQYHSFEHELASVLPSLDVVVIDFAGFRDGRGYSLAQEIRQHANFTQKTVLRVMGDILPDTLELLVKVGFEEFDIENPSFNENWFNWFESIKTPYDGRSVKQLPMFAGVG